MLIGESDIPDSNQHTRGCRRQWRQANAISIVQSIIDIKPIIQAADNVDLGCLQSILLVDQPQSIGT